jgi:colanic acid biosynthesis glycosyl transferase WcaI
MARILVVGINYAPENIGTGKYTAEMCEWLAARGHEVRVITAPPYYPAWKVWPEHRSRGYRREQVKGVDVLRCPIWVPEKPRGVTRMLHLASFALTSGGALLSALHWKPNWVLNIAPTLASAPASLAFARLTGARSWLHVQDFEVDAAMDMGIVRPGRLRKMAMATEQTLLRTFDVVSTISTRMMDRLEAKGVPANRRVEFPNWADIDGITPLNTCSPYRAELGIPEDAVVALYSGNMGQKQGLEILGEAACALAIESNLYFVFGGEGPARVQLEQACGRLDKVRFVDLQPIARLRDWLGLADIHLLPQREDVADLVMPSKLTGMLASGRPVLATAHPKTGVAEAVRTCGIATPPGNSEALIDALRQLSTDTALRYALGRAARAQAESALAREDILLRFEERILNSSGQAEASRGPKKSKSSQSGNPA